MKKIYLLSILAVILVCDLSTFSLQAQKVIRGPYMQSPAPYSIIMRWRTDSLTDSRVNYGTTAGSLTFHADSATPTTEHRVKINGLSARTKYYYNVGSSTQVLKADSRMYFTTAIDSTMSDPVRFWVIGDFGHGNTAERDVRNSYYNYAANHPADFQLWVGDNAYSDGKDQEYQDKVFDTVNSFGNTFLNLPFVPTSGNHDWNSICAWTAPCNTDPNLQTGPYLNIIDPPTEGEQGGVASHKKLFYSFDYGDIHFVCLNSELGATSAANDWLGVQRYADTSFNSSPMLDWLKADLAATTKKWKIAFWHQCPYSGQDNLTELSSFQLFCIAARNHFNPIIERYGIDLVLTGHDHNYQRGNLINGHYGYMASFTPSMMLNNSSGNDDLGEAYIKYTNGPLAGKGAVYVVQGNSSEGNSYSTISHPAIHWGEACDTCYGSLMIDVNGDRLDGHYFTSNGVVRDQFTIKKQAWTGIDEEDAAFDHFYVFPNPFREQTRISYTVLKKCPVKIDVLDARGKVVMAYFSGYREPGDYG